MQNAAARFEKIAFRKNSLNRDGLNRNKEFPYEIAKTSPNSKFALFCGDLVFFEKPLDAICGARFYTWLEIQKLIDDDCIWIYGGQDEDGNHYFLIDVKTQKRELFEQNLGGEFSSLRAMMWHIEIENLEVFGLGASLFAWHKNHQYCAKCGAKTILQDWGFKRLCQNCETEHFPRIDPVVIMLVLHNDKCLIGRSKLFPPSLYSTLAGFMEPCETIEQACRREVFEEVGLVVEDIKYIANQPWPFASQLMLGLVAYAKDSKIKINPDELENALWVDKKQMRQLLTKEGLQIDGQIATGPRPSAIAHSLLTHWLFEL
jgi:NADH pyrophosphatase NudC (nudix superfamily)